MKSTLQASNQNSSSLHFFYGPLLSKTLLGRLNGTKRSLGSRADTNVVIS